MKVLITGASGMLGCTLAPFLQGRGYSVIRHGHQGIADVSCDLTIRGETESMLTKLEPDVIINLVAATNVDECERQPNRAYLLNVRTVENLVEAVERHQRSFLIHVSTDQVYDAPGPSTEDEICLRNTYALTKYAGELAAKRISSAILRTNFFGLSRHEIRKSFSDWLLENFLNARPFNTFENIVSSPLSMMTLSCAIEHVLRRPIAGVFNVGSSDSLSKADFANALAKVYGLSTTFMKKCNSTDVSLEAYRPNDMSMNSKKFEETFGFNLPKLEDEIEHLREEKNAYF